jgi:hypothetical protein
VGADLRLLRQASVVSQECDLYAVVALYLIKCLGAVAGLTDYPDIRDRCEHHDQVGAYQGIVVARRSLLGNPAYQPLTQGRERSSAI